MAKYKYVWPTPRWVDTGGVRPVKVEQGDVVEIDDALAVQDGSKGERVFFEKVVAVKKTVKKKEEE